MLTQTIGSKKYTLEKIDYSVVGGIENLYLQFKIEQDIEFGVHTYYYGFTATEESMNAMMEQLGQGFAGIVIQRLLEENA